MKEARSWSKLDNWRKQDVAVLCRNWRLFRRVFQSHRCVRRVGGAHMHFVHAWISNESTKRIWTPPLMEVQWYGALNTANLNGITFGFYTGLPQMHIRMYHHFMQKMTTGTAVWNREECDKYISKSNGANWASMYKQHCDRYHVTSYVSL